jgi:hypothetical protein
VIRLSSAPQRAPHAAPARHAPAFAHLSVTRQRVGVRAGGAAAGVCGLAWPARGPCARPSSARTPLTHALFAHARTHLTGSHYAQDARAIVEGLTRGVSAETTTLAQQQQRSDKHIKRMAIHMAKVQVQGSSSSGGK